MPPHILPHSVMLRWKHGCAQQDLHHARRECVVCSQPMSPSGEGVQLVALAYSGLSPVMVRAYFWRGRRDTRRVCKDARLVKYCLQRKKSHSRVSCGVKKPATGKLAKKKTLEMDCSLPPAPKLEQQQIHSGGTWQGSPCPHGRLSRLAKRALGANMQLEAFHRPPLSSWPALPSSMATHGATPAMHLLRDRRLPAFSWQ